MSTLTAWPMQAETWLDRHGRPAWIAAMVLGFIVFWPVGLALLAYMIWSKRMFTETPFCRTRRQPRHSGTGNAAFDAYKADTLKRLEDEQAAFEAFMARLRAAKDKSEFDAFMADRAASASTPVEGAQD
ncbi:MAG: DUF2852 domain-containing protein [Rhodobacteraceae bacterium]|nr:DUF2852 domain-containing protein [Paracoccaceae bacterium]